MLGAGRARGQTLSWLETDRAKWGWGIGEGGATLSYLKTDGAKLTPREAVPPFPGRKLLNLEMFPAFCAHSKCILSSAIYFSLGLKSAKNVATNRNCAMFEIENTVASY